MAETAPLTNFACEPDPDNPGWQRWRIIDATPLQRGRARQAAGPRRRAARTARVRIQPQVPLHTNSAGNVHGAITLALIDISLFAAAHVLGGVDAGRSVTLDLQTQFIGAGDSIPPARQRGRTAARDPPLRLPARPGRAGRGYRRLVHRDHPQALWPQTVRAMTSVLARYEALLASGELKPDPEQAAAADRLGRLQHELESTAGAARHSRQAVHRASRRRRAASICGAGSGAASRC